MRCKTRKPRKTKKSQPQKTDINENKGDFTTENISLPVLSNESIYSEGTGRGIGKCKYTKASNLLNPKVSLVCLPLNIEKVLDLTTNKVIKCGKIRKTRNKKTSDKAQPANKHITVIRNKRTLRPRGKDEKEHRYLYNSPSTEPNIKIYIKESKYNLKKDAAVSCKDNQKVEIDSATETFEGKSELCLQQTEKNVQVQKAEVTSEDNKAYLDMGIKGTELQITEDVATEVQVTEDVATEVQVTEDVATEVHVTEDVTTELQITLAMNEAEAKNSLKHLAEPCPEDKSCNTALESFDTNRCTSLQTALECSDMNEHSSLPAAMESFMNNHQLDKQKDIDALKNGLCPVWISNNYKCSNRLCPYHHNASKLFIKKLKQYASKHIMTILVAMKNDVLFVDVVLAAFNILSERKAPDFWITFLIYFVFYVTDPSDSRFFRFWASSARFFYELNENSAAARGFASLLSIFSHGEKADEWKIIEFIKFIKQSPVQIHTTYDLLQPILKLDLPSSFLIEAVESCIATYKDVLEVYSLIIPKISIMTSPISVIELLLRFCTTLESIQKENFAVELKHKLKQKVRMFKIKICKKDYPLTAAFQEKMLESSEENNAPIDIFNPDSDSEIVVRKSNYFLPEGDFYSNVTRALELISNKPFDLKRVEKPQETLNKEEEETYNRQVTRVKQFFSDCQFEVLGKYLNGLTPGIIEQAAQEFLKALLKMKITFQQVLDLIKIMLLHCQSETAAKINASICITLIVNFIRINEWEKAYTILSLCEEKRINLVEGKVYYITGFNVTQMRVLLLLMEIYMYKENFEAVLTVIKMKHLYSDNTSVWKLSWSDNDEAIRVRILEEFLSQTILKQLTSAAYEIFMLLWMEQNTLHNPVDLTKFTNEMLILLLNQNVGEGVKFFDKVRNKVTLSETATRAVLVTLVGQNNLKDAKNVMMALNQSTYTPPEVTPEGATVTMSSFWLEGEIYVMLDTLFDILVEEVNPALRDFENFEVEIRITKPKAAPSIVRPLCLGLMNSSLQHACMRIQRVLEHQFKPSIKLIILPYSLVLDKPTLQTYLERRFRRPSG